MRQSDTTVRGFFSSSWSLAPLRLKQVLHLLTTYVWNDARKEEAEATRGLIVLTRSYYIIPTFLIFINLVFTWGVRFRGESECFAKMKQHLRDRPAAFRLTQQIMMW